MALGADNNLMFGIDCCNPGVTLDDAFLSGHLGTVVIGAVAFDGFALVPRRSLGCSANQDRNCLAS